MTKRNLRALARSLFDVAVEAADPALAVRRELTANSLCELTGGRYLILAFGKAACAMTTEAISHIPASTPFEAFAVTNTENVREVPHCETVAARHPVPDERGRQASLEVRRRLQAAGGSDVVLCLISGGGSALLVLPPPEIPLADKIAVNEILLNRGFDIYQTNLVRQQLSQLKGGGLAQLAFPARVRSLIVSDVVGDDPRCIASGPTSAPLGSPADAVQLLKHRGLWEEIPASVRNYLDRTASLAPPTSSKSAENSIVASNWRSLEAIAAAAPHLSPMIVSGRLNGDVGNAAHEIMNQVKARPPECRLLIWGGETTVRVNGDGTGGRNQELALRVSMAAQGIKDRWVFLSGGTDGRDGPTDAAGGLVDSGTIRRIEETGANASALISNNDSYSALSASGDLLMTGATGTNVADIQLFLRDPERRD